MSNEPTQPTFNWERFKTWFLGLSGILQGVLAAIPAIAILCVLMWFFGGFDAIGQWWDHRQDAAFDKKDEKRADEIRELQESLVTVAQEKEQALKELAESRAREQVYRAAADKTAATGEQIDAAIEQHQKEMRERGDVGPVDPDAVLERLRARRRPR